MFDSPPLNWLSQGRERGEAIGFPFPVWKSRKVGSLLVTSPLTDPVLVPSQGPFLLQIDSAGQFASGPSGSIIFRRWGQYKQLTGRL